MFCLDRYWKYGFFTCTQNFITGYFNKAEFSVTHHRTVKASMERPYSFKCLINFEIFILLLMLLFWIFKITNMWYRMQENLIYTMWYETFCMTPSLYRRIFSIFFLYWKYVFIWKMSRSRVPIIFEVVGIFWNLTRLGGCSKKWLLQNDCHTQVAATATKWLLQLNLTQCRSLCCGGTYCQNTFFIKYSQPLKSPIGIQEPCWVKACPHPLPKNTWLGP